MSSLPTKCGRLRRGIASRQSALLDLETMVRGLVGPSMTRILWKYCMFFKQMRENLIDQHKTETGRLGR